MLVIERVITALAKESDTSRIAAIMARRHVPPISAVYISIFLVSLRLKRAMAPHRGRRSRSLSLQTISTRPRRRKMFVEKL